MPTIITRWEFRKTTRTARSECPGYRHLSYDQAFDRMRFPLDGYIFTDLDRLSVFELELAAILYRKLRDGGARVLNDPAGVLLRFDLLKALHREGINDFNVYRPQYGEWPQRYPVFLRREAFHMGTLTEPLADESELKNALEETLRAGIPLRNTMAVEYASEPSEGGIYRKPSVYRIGDQYFRDTTVNQEHWSVKSGRLGIASDAFYAEERSGMDQVPHLDLIRRVFETARIEYGRVDIGYYKGRPQFYEINTNPNVSFARDHPNPDRVASRQKFADNYKRAITALALKNQGGKILIESRLLHKRRRNFRWFLRQRSRPSW